MYRNIPILYRILESLFRYRNLFLICTIIITVIPGAVILSRKTTYSSAALTQVVIEDVSSALGDTNRNGSWLSIAQQNVNRFNEWMKDDSPGGFLDLALRKARLDRTVHVDPRLKDRRLTALRKDLNTFPVSDTVFSINLVWEDPAECEQIVKAFQSEYIERSGMDKQTQSTAVVQFLDSELEQYASRLRVSEQAVIDFKKLNSGQTAGAQSAAMDELSLLKMRLNDLEVSSHNNDITRELVQKRIAQIKPTSIMEQHFVESAVKDSPQITQKNAIEAKRTNLLIEGWLPTSSRIQVLDTEIAVLKQSLAAEIKTDPSKGPIPDETILQDNPEYRELQQKLTENVISENTEQAQMIQLRQRIGEYEARLARLPIAEAHLNDRMRDFNILKTEYEELLKRREQARLKTNLDKVAAISSLHGLGTVYAQSTGGKTKTAFMLIGLLVLGLTIGLIVTILAEWADPAVRFASDIQRRLGVTALISLPELEPLRVAGSSVDGGFSSARPLLPARNE